MKKSILAILMLILVCFCSCNISALSELLGKARGKFVEANKKVENLNFSKENKETHEGEKPDVFIRNRKGVGISKKDFQEKEGIDLSQAKLTNDQEKELSNQEIKANDINIKVNAQLVKISALNDELNKSLAGLNNMKSYIISANSDFDVARRPYSIDQKVTQSLPLLHQAIKNVEMSSDVAITLYRDKLLALGHAKTHAEHAKISIESALGKAVQVKSGEYYAMYNMINNILDANESLIEAANMFRKVELEMDDLRASLKKAEENFVDLKREHQVVYEALLTVKKK